MVVLLRKYHENNATPKKKPEGTPDPQLTAYAKKTLRKYWVVDRLLCVLLFLVVSVCLFLLEFFFRLEEGIINNAGFMVLVITLIICSFLKRSWDRYRDKEVRIESKEIYGDLAKHESFHYIGQRLCTVEMILKAYFPDRAWMSIAWLASLLCMGIACDGYHKGQPINVPLLIFFGVAIFLLSWALDYAIRKWLEPLIQRLKSQRIQQVK